jgi:hypothetical protein
MLFDKYGVDLVFGGDNYNYQRTFPLKFNINADSSNPIITDRNQTNYKGGYYHGQIYLITGTAGKSHYDIKEQAPFVANQNDDEDDNTLGINSIIKNNNILDQFTISKN